MPAALNMLLAALVLAAALPAQRTPRNPAAIWEHLSRQYDKDQDGRITPAEHARGEHAFANLDRNGDGAITREDLAGAGRRPGAAARGAARPSRPVESALLKVGDVAPDFELPVLVVTPPEPAGEERKVEQAQAPQLVKLSTYAGKRPVALIFGSYT